MKPIMQKWIVLLFCIYSFGISAQNYNLFYKETQVDVSNNDGCGVCIHNVVFNLAFITNYPKLIEYNYSYRSDEVCDLMVVVCLRYRDVCSANWVIAKDTLDPNIIGHVLKYPFNPVGLKYNTSIQACVGSPYVNSAASYNFDYQNYKIKSINIDQTDGKNSVKFQGEFVCVPDVKTYPVILSKNSNGIVNDNKISFEAPDFLKNNFSPNQIKWKVEYNDVEIYKNVGYQLDYQMDATHKCLPLKVYAYVEDGYGWQSDKLTFQFQPEPNLIIGSTLLITQPLCTESQKNGNDYKTQGHILLGNDVIDRKFKVTLYDNQNNPTGFTLEKNPTDKFLLSEGSPYSLKVEEDFGNNITSCAQIINNIQINAPKPIDLVQSNFTDIQCFGQKPKLAITIDGNTNNYTLSYGDSVKVLSQNQIYSIPLMTQSRTYSFSITDENACVYDQALNFTTTEPSKLEATMQIDSAVCYRGTTTVRINAKGGTPYSSENPYRYGFAPSSSVQLDPILLTKGGVTIYPRVYDKNNCSISFPVTTLFNPKDFKLSVLEKFDNICPKGKVGSVLLTSQSIDKSYRYTFSKNGIDYVKDSLFQSLGAGVYTFHAQNQYGCLKDTTLQITEPPYISISKTALDSVRCFGEQNGSIQLNVTGGTGFKKLWKNKEPAYLPSNKSYSFSHTYDSLAGRSYWFHAQDSLGCLDSIAYSIGTRSHIQHRSNMISPSCNESKDGQITAYTEGGVAPYNNSWVNRPELGSSLLQKGLAKGTYILLSIDQLGCQKNDTMVLQAPPSLLVDLQGYPLICKGQSVELDAGIDGDRYLWSGSNGFSATTRKVTIDKRGTYWVEVKDYNSCLGSDTISFEQSDTEFKVDFLMATTVVQGDTVVLLNDNVSIDSMRWNLNPNNTQTLPPSLDFRAQEAIFRDLGEQDVQLMGYYKGCRDVRTRKIWVITPQDRNKYDQSIGIKTSVIRECGLFPNPNDGSFEIHIELNEANVPVAMVLSSLATGISIKKLDWKIYPDDKIAFQEDLPEGAYIIHVKVRDEVVALRFLVVIE